MDASLIDDIRRLLDENNKRVTMDEVDWELLLGSPDKQVLVLQFERQNGGSWF